MACSILSITLRSPMIAHGRSIDVRMKTRREFLWFTAAAVAAPVLPQTGPRISTIAGTGMAGTAGDGEAADRAAINNPFGLVIGPDGALYWAVFGSNRVLRLDLRTKIISIIAGSGT